MSSFESVLTKYIGPAGRWQWIAFMLINLTIFGNFSSFPQLASLTPSHNCYIPIPENVGLSQSEIRSIAIPSIKKTIDNVSEFQNCHQYKQIHGVTNLTNIDNINDTFHRETKVPCRNGWFYDKITSYFLNSYTEHFDLVCDRQYYLPLSSSLYFIGTIIGRIFGGFLADRFGRKSVIIISCILTFVFGTSVALSPNIWVFSILRLLVGISSNSSVVAAIVYWSEITNYKYRNTFGFIYGIHDSFIVPGTVILVAYILQDWRYLHVAVSVMYVLAVFHVCILYESPQWLLSTNQTKKGIKVIKNAMRINGTLSKFSKSQLQRMENDLRMFYDSVKCPDCHLRTSNSWKDNVTIVLFTRPYLRRRILPFLYIWIVIMALLMGMQYYSVRMEDSNPYVFAFIGCIFSLPVLFIKQFLYHFFDRKRPLIAIFILSGIVSVIGAALRGANIEGPWNAAIGTIVFGCALVAQNMCYALTAESFPTIYRTYAMGLVSGVGRSGAVFSTFIERLDLYVWSGLPLLIFGILTFIAAWAIYSLPGTETLEDEIDEERLRKNTSIISETDIEAVTSKLEDNHRKIKEDVPDYKKMIGNDLQEKDSSEINHNIEISKNSDTELLFKESSETREYIADTTSSVDDVL